MWRIVQQMPWHEKLFIKKTKQLNFNLFCFTSFQMIKIAHPLIQGWAIFAPLTSLLDLWLSAISPKTFADLYLFKLRPHKGHRIV